MAKVLVGMSGGVDSSVAAKLLLDAGHEVAGVTLKLFDNGDVYGDSCATRTCCALSDVEDARAVAYKLGIEHFVFNFRDLFAEKVISRFVDSYLAGNTPNPCIDCNRFVKFDKLIERALALGYDSVATGHYSTVRQDYSSGRWLLGTGKDPSKDQSYVLYNLTQHQLAHTLFPLAGYEKTEVRRIAEEAGLVNARKPDSQDICFVPDGDYPAFIDRMTGRPYPAGNYLDANGKVIGRHRGVTHYTIGQRRGIAIALGKPTYVVSRNAKDNTVTLGGNDDLMRDELIAGDLNFIPFERLDEPLRVTAKIRYNQKAESATVFPLETNLVRVIFDRPQRAVAPGQAVVFYLDNLVAGGGTIEDSSFDKRVRSGYTI